LTDFVCLLTYEFCLSLWKIARCSVILLLPLFNKYISLILNLKPQQLYSAHFGRKIWYIVHCICSLL